MSGDGGRPARQPRWIKIPAAQQPRGDKGQRLCALQGQRHLNAGNAEAHQTVRNAARFASELLLRRFAMIGAKVVQRAPRHKEGQQLRRHRRAFVMMCETCADRGAA